MHWAEDANVGLCMHLLSVRLIEHECFVQSRLIRGEHQHLETLFHRMNGSHERWDATQWARIVRCPRPITMHSIKLAKDQLAWWELLDHNDRGTTRGGTTTELE